MRIITLLTAICLLCTTAIKAQTVKPAGTTVNWLSYTEEKSQVSVQYPDTWSLKTTNPKSSIVLYAPADGDDDKFSENINAVIRELPAGSSTVPLKDIMESVQQKLAATFENFDLKYSKTVTWNGEEAGELSFSGTKKTDNDKTANVAMTQRMIITNGKLIVFTYTADGTKEDVHKTLAMQIFEKVKW